MNARPIVLHPKSEVRIARGAVVLNGFMEVPAHARGLVVFAHGSGSGRFSARNQQVAEALREQGLATLLFDLLTAEEEQRDAASACLRFEIGLLAERLGMATDWVLGREEAAGLPIGYFGASTGAAAALRAAAAAPDRVHAVVSRGGRADLAGEALERVAAPTLMIAGGKDTAVVELNEEAFHRLRSLRCLEVVPGAGHLFEEPGALDAVASLAGAWFVEHLSLGGKRA